MSKFNAVLSDVFSIFNDPLWKAESIETAPRGVKPSVTAMTFVRISIITKEPGVNFKSSSGQLIADIFTPLANGPKAQTIIADKLELYIAGKSFTTNAGGTTQFGVGTLSKERLDRDNPNLNIISYTIPFNYFGVQ